MRPSSTCVHRPADQVLEGAGVLAAELDREVLLAHALALEGRAVAHGDRDLDGVDLDPAHLDRPRGHVAVATFETTCS